MSHDNLDQQMLCQHWIHSREEDTESETVYRPSDYEFPPSRGRTGIEFRADGKFVEYVVGPTDRPVDQPGHWEVIGNQVAISSRRDAEPSQMLNIKSIDENKLVLHSETP